MKLAIIGSRGFNDYNFLKETVLMHFCCLPALIVSGGAKGADRLGERFANDMDIPKKIFKPDWEKHGKRAGFIRNDDIVKEADVVLAFWDGESRGTKDSLGRAKRYKKPTFIYYVEV